MGLNRSQFSRSHTPGSRVVWSLLAVVLAGVAGCPEVQVPDPAVRYVAFGDSSTDGPSERDYPDILREQLGEAPETFANEGKGGETAADGLERLDMLFSMDLYPNAHTLFYWQGAAAVIDFIQQVDPLLLLSPNSPNYPFSEQLSTLLDNVEANIREAIGRAQTAGLTVYVATYYTGREALQPCDALFLDIILPGQVRNANVYLDLLNERIRRAAADTGATLVDIATLDAELQAESANYFDCNHLSAEGNALVAERFLAIISQVD